MKLTESKDGLTKESNGSTLGIQQTDSNLGITLFRHTDHTLIMAQLDRAEKAKLIAYLGGDKLLCETIKKYESLQEDSLNRMEELRDTIKELLAASKKLSHLHACEQEGISSGQPKVEDWIKAVDQLNLSIEKAEKQIS
jgi:hypothetical protein